ncbi:unnamed protein product [Urochloa humidicola]
MVLSLLLAFLMASLTLEHTSIAADWAWSNGLAKAQCPFRCGNVSIPYPFGLGENCSREGFSLTCDVVAQAPYLGEYKILDINLSQGQVRVQNSISFTCGSQVMSPVFTPVHPFTVSSKNKFIAIGCSIVAFMQDQNQSGYTSACGAFCNKDSMGNSLECAGIGCCQTSIPFPGNLRSLHTSFTSFPRQNFGPCSYAFVAEAEWFQFDPSYVKSTKFRELFGTKDGGVPLVLDWAVGNESCDASKGSSSYACTSSFSECVNMSNNGTGYRCMCIVGFEGNPYLDEGCTDIDECKQPDKHPCSGGICKNTIGSYQCIANHQHKGIGLSIGIGLASAAGLIFLVGIGICTTQKFKHTRALKLKQKYFEQNRGQLLQQLVSQRTDIAERMIITSDEIAKATNNFDPARELGGGGHGTVYKGILSDLHVVAIKKSNITVQREIHEFINEVAILSQINHRNVVKIIGCCLETEVPLLVYEFISNGTLYHHLHVGSPRLLSWINRLRIATETANAIAYLHSSVSIPIIHRDIKSSNILLDDTLTSKVSDFGASRYIPVDRTGLTTVVQGTIGYLDPMYFYTSRLTDKSDVYSFGVLLVELLTRKKPSYLSSSGDGLVAHFVNLHGEGNLEQILDPQVLHHGGKEVKEVAELAVSCVRLRPEDRPTMRQVDQTLQGLMPSDNHVKDNTLAERYEEIGNMVMDFPSIDESTQYYSLEQDRPLMFSGSR